MPVVVIGQINILPIILITMRYVKVILSGVGRLIQNHMQQNIIVKIEQNFQCANLIQRGIV